jgi:putative DNA primase/helicase
MKELDDILANTMKPGDPRIQAKIDSYSHRNIRRTDTQPVCNQPNSLEISTLNETSSEISTNVRPLKLPNNTAIKDSTNTKSSTSVKINNKNDSAKMTTTWGDQIVPKKINWVWKDYLAAGELTIIAGEPATGKTTIALDIAAHITRGEHLPFPDTTFCESPGIVIIWSREESVEHSLISRLKAHSADLSKILFAGEIVDGEEERDFQSPRDIDTLRKAIKSAEEEKGAKVKLIIIDSLADIMSGDHNNNADARKSLKALRKLTEEEQIAIIGITHFSKGGGMNWRLIDLIMGSRAVSALAGMIYATGSVKNTELSGIPSSQKYVVANLKNRNGTPGGGYFYHMKSIITIDDIKTFKLEWDEKAVGTAEDLLEKPKRLSFGSQEGKQVIDSQIGKAVRFLKETLNDGAVPSKQVKELASKADHKWRTVQRAMEEMGITAKIIDGESTWKLPDPTNFMEDDE